MAGGRIKNLFKSARKGKRATTRVPKAVKAYVHKEFKKEEGKVNQVVTWYNNNAVTLLGYAGTPITVLVNGSTPNTSSTNYGLTDNTYNQYGLAPTISGGNGFLALQPMVRGSDYMRMVRFHAKGQFQYLLNQGTAAANPLTLRIILYVDKMCKASLPSASQVLDTSDSVYSVYNTSNVDFAKRFKILYDKTMTMPKNHTVPQTAGGATIASLASYNWELKKKLNFITAYNRNYTGSYSDIDSGALCLAFISDDGQTGGVPNTWQFMNMSITLEAEQYSGRGIRKI